ncbi:NHL repeat-containing protein [Desertivirga arenae]|uniref:NHL repeat-containing protein n=1 Tax=Desertivirga arenae TaxID=2810309 RepID=UPI001A979588|nr:NHL repeat-containing protein [Pedobacter sp. SYSU D00823]
MSQNRKNLILFLAMIIMASMTACEKNDELKRQISELETRVSGIESQISEINKNLITLYQQDKLTGEEVAALKALTGALSTITTEIKSQVSLNAAEIEKLKAAIANAATLVQYEQLKATLNQLEVLINNNHIEQLATDEATKKLNSIVIQLSADVEHLKSVEQVIRLDRPINVTATKGSYGNRIIISWTPMPLAKNYQLFKFNSLKEQYEMISEGSDTTFTDVSSFNAYEKVFYKVRVVNSSTAYSEFSDVNFGYTSGLKYSLYLYFGYEGSAPGLFSFAMHVATDASDNIFISDEGNNRVQKFDRSGNFMEVFYNGSGARAVAFLKNGNTIVTRTQSSSYIQILSPQKAVVSEWGTYGTGNSQFENIEEITLDDEENLYVVDGTNNYVKKFDSNGNFLLKFQGATRVANQSDTGYPFGICFLNNKLFVTSSRNSLVRVFDKEGNLIKTWDAGSIGYAIKAHKGRLYIACSGYILKTDENGEVKEKIGEGLLGNYGIITGLAVNSRDEVIVSNVYARSIRVFKAL